MNTGDKNETVKIGTAYLELRGNVEKLYFWLK